MNSPGFHFQEFNCLQILKSNLHEGGGPLIAHIYQIWTHMENYVCHIGKCQMVTE